MDVPEKLIVRRVTAEMHLVNRLLHWNVSQPDDPLDHIEGVVDERDFHDPFLKAVFVVAVSLYARRKFSVQALYQWLSDGGVPNLDQSFKGLEGGYVFDHLSVLARDVRVLANKARLVEVVDMIEARISNVEYDDETWEAFIETEIGRAVRRGAREKGAAALSENVDEWLDAVERFEPAAGGLSTGVEALDAEIGGLRAGDLVVIGGRPSMGKTIIGTTMLRACAEAGFGGLMFSLEMPRAQLRTRLLCDLARDEHKVAYSTVMANRASATDIAYLRRAAERLKTFPIIVDDRGGLSMEQIAYGARRAERAFEGDGKELGLIVVDYLQLMALPKEWRSDKNNGVGANSSGLKRLAKELGVPIVVLSQLSRQVEQRDNKRPMLSDLRDSGSIEQDADVVIFPFREEYYLQKEAADAKKESARIELMADLGAVKNRIELAVEKQRNGPRATIMADCDAATSSIRSFGKIRPEERDMFTGAAA